MHPTDIFTVTTSFPTGQRHIFQIPHIHYEELEALLSAYAKRSDADSVPAENIFPQLYQPHSRSGILLKGARLRKELTQKQLAGYLGIKQHHLSEMENHKRTIGKEMARKISSVLDVDYRLFL